jgi:hypothetical protein
LCKCGAIFFLIPPIQSEPGERLSLMPGLLYGGILFITGLIVEKHLPSYPSSWYRIAVDLIFYCLLGAVILARVKAGMLNPA